MSMSITFAPSLPYSGAGMHLRPEENKKKKWAWALLLLPACPIIALKKAIFLRGGGTNFQASSIATAFEISTWNFVGMFF